MRILITGGTGFIGRHLIPQLLDNGHEVTVLTRNPQKQTSLPPKVRLVGWNPGKLDGWAHLMDTADAVINLAGESIAGDSLPSLVVNRWTKERKAAILNSRILAGQALTAAIEQSTHKPEVLIQASAVGYYGDRGDDVLTEDTHPGSDFAAQVCQAWEHSTIPVEKLGVRRAIIRTAGVVMSLDGGSLPFIVLPFRFFAGGPLASGRQWFSWIHMADEVGAIEHLINTPAATGAFNLCGPQTVTNAEFSKILGRVMNRPSFFPTPGFALRLAFGEKAGVLLGSQKQIPRKLLESGYRFHYPEVEPALANLFAA